MVNVAGVGKRVILGRAMRSDKLGETLLPKRIALPVFASDALSSVAYATQEILLVLALAGTAFLHLTWYAAFGVVIVMLTVVAAYRQNVHAYPSGGGDYEVANTNLGKPFGLVVAAALLVDYVLTVAVSTSAGVENLASTPLFEWMAGARVETTLGVVVFIVLMNLRGIRESGIAFAIPTYAFMFGIIAMIGTGLYELASGQHLQAATANYPIKPELHNLGTAGIIFLGMRAFSSGCTALTGVEAISNGVPAFRKPKSKNAANTLALMGGIALTMFIGVTFLAVKFGVRVTENNADLIGFHGATQDTVIAQIGNVVFHGENNLPFYFVQLVTALILVLAANTAFNGFPVLASILAQDRYMPRQMHNRGDRLVFSNGIVLLAGFACLLIWAFKADSTKLIQLYIVGVFVSFTCSQAGMVRHWNRLLLTQTDPAARRQTLRRRGISGFAFFTTGFVLIIVLLTKFVSGAWIAIVAMTFLWFLMRGIHRHYENVARELAVADDQPTLLPSRVHSIVLVSKIHKPTLQAIAYARATRPSTLEALTVAIDPDEAAALLDEWERRKIPVPLKILESPYREITRPVVSYVLNLRKESPRDLVTVFVPEYVVGKWWEQLLHNQSALRLRTRLRFANGVVVTSVPYLLASGEAVKDAQYAGGGATTVLSVVRRARTTTPTNIDVVDSTLTPPARPPPRSRRRWPTGSRPDDAPPAPLPVSASQPVGPIEAGAVLELEVGPVAHGGHCVARHLGQVVFVRHALPGELVRARVTDSGAKFLRADAVEILRPSADRVEPRCPHARPGGCGGCDFQHASASAQRGLKAAVVAEQLQRLGGLAWDVEVEAPPGDGFGWRTRLHLAVDAAGNAGLHPHRSHAVLPLTDCPLAAEVTNLPELLGRSWSGVRDLEVAASVTSGERVVLADGKPLRRNRLTERAGGRSWRISGAGFWQVHPAAADLLVAAVRGFLAPRPGEHLLDLYAGVGLFAGALAVDLAPTGRVDAVESEATAVRDARRNLHDLPEVALHHRTVDAWLRDAVADPAARCDLVVLDPPRTGAGRSVVERLVTMQPRAVAYVACDPASLGRDVGTFRSLGWELAGLRAFDLFPQTHHVECVALLQPSRDIS